MYITNIDFFVNDNVRNNFITELNNVENICSEHYRTHKHNQSIDISESNTIEEAIYNNRNLILSKIRDKNFKILSTIENIAYAITRDGELRIIRLNDYDKSNTYKKSVFIYKIKPYKNEYLYGMIQSTI
jgi:hypothetical protein